MKKYIKRIINFGLNNFTLAKLLGGLFTAFAVALLKYCISGSLQIDYCEFWNNLGVAFLGWTINTGIISWLTEHLGIKGINFNLNQFIYGFDTMKAGQVYYGEDFKPKLYHAMGSDGESNPNRGLDKGKGVDKETHPNYDRDTGIVGNNTPGESKRLNKVKVVLDSPAPTEPHMVT